MRRKLKVGVFLLGFLAAAMLFYSSSRSILQAADIDTPTFAELEREVQVGEFVRMHISELSPEGEKSGRKFHVTDIETHKTYGIVSYGDGHVTRKARFTYDIEPDHTVNITSFTVLN